MSGYPIYASSSEYLQRVCTLLPGLASAADALVDVLAGAFDRGRTVFLAGNGGSAAAASHFAQDLAKGTLVDIRARRRFRVIALTDSIGYITALANDDGYEFVFEHQMRAFAEAKDVLVAISGSGNSPSIVNAVKLAKSVGMTVVGVTGFSGGKLRSMCDVAVHVPVDDMGMCEAIHGILFHNAMARLREYVTRANTALGEQPSV